MARGEPDFRLLFESAPGAYLVLTPELVIVAVSDAYLRATMTERAAITGRRLFDVFPDNPDDAHATGSANLRASLERVLSSGQLDAMAVQKYDVRRPDTAGGGFEERYWSPVNTPVVVGSAVRYIVHRVEDVTDFVRMKRGEDVQRQVVDELRTRAGQMEAEVFRRAQELQDANRQLRLLQLQLEDEITHRTSDLHQAKEELTRHASARVETERALRVSEEQLRQALKIEAVGRLAGGIAHDFNNLLSVVLGYSDLVLAEVRPGDPHHEEILGIRDAGVRASALTKQLLIFSRQQVLEPTVVDLNRIIDTASLLLTRLIGEDIDLRISTNARFARVLGDPTQLEQVVMNLAVNARDAMPNGGKLTVLTENVELDETFCQAHPQVVPGDYVLLTVSDTGAGMDTETQARVFEPFFTTKARGKGTGLGLSTVFGIVKQGGGHVWLYSEPGMGTTFKVYLPRVDIGSVPPPEEKPVPVGGTETILLTEDQSDVRKVAQAILQRAGYHVLSAGTPAEALEICERYDGPIDLLLTDVVMPGMNGSALANSVSAMRPQIKVLFMSGYTDDVVVHHVAVGGNVALLQKPLIPDAMLLKVRQILDLLHVPRA